MLSGFETLERAARQLTLAPLEPRVLLAADVLTVDLSALNPDQRDYDLLVRMQNEVVETVSGSTTVERVQILDRSGNKVLAFGDLSEFSGISIRGGAGADTLTIDTSSFGEATLPTIAFDGLEGDDRLVVDSGEAVSWVIDGADAGSLSGPVNGTFSGVDSLTGAAGNEDTFRVAAGGTLSGVIDGGAGGYDTLVFEGGYASVLYLPNGLDSGGLVVDGNSFDFVGLEPVDVGAIADLVIDFSEAGIGDLPASPVHVVLEESGTPGSFVLSNDDIANPGGAPFESIQFTPSSSLTILTGAGDDIIRLDAEGAVFSASLSIGGDSGADSVVFSTGIAITGALVVNAEDISVESGAVSASGAISFTAAASDSESKTGQSDATQTAIAAATASISVQSLATLSGASVTLAAIATTTASIGISSSAVSSLSADTDATATVTIDGAVTATGAVDVRAGVVNTVSLTATGAAGLRDVTVTADSTATIDVGAAAAITGATVALLADTAVDVTVDVEGLANPDLFYGDLTVGFDPSEITDGGSEHFWDQLVAAGDSTLDGIAVEYEDVRIQADTTLTILTGAGRRPRSVVPDRRALRSGGRPWPCRFRRCWDGRPVHPPGPRPCAP